MDCTDKGAKEPVEEGTGPENTEDWVTVVDDREVSDGADLDWLQVTDKELLAGS